MYYDLADIALNYTTLNITDVENEDLILHYHLFHPLLQVVVDGTLYEYDKDFPIQCFDDTVYGVTHTPAALLRSRHLV